uniref:Uncharacterized protein LOC101507840 isoform X2 n=1 Tax=Cicer arietinum TaxID=3827 RepID=A0A1S2YHX5_CICAR|nr:uncharacterized protein LOC101507840 isoform X2 [Cicer arietinum]
MVSLLIFIVKHKDLKSYDYTILLSNGAENLAIWRKVPPFSSIAESICVGIMKLNIYHNPATRVPTKEAFKLSLQRWYHTLSSIHLHHSFSHSTIYFWFREVLTYYNQHEDCTETIDVHHSTFFMKRSQGYMEDVHHSTFFMKRSQGYMEDIESSIVVPRHDTFPNDIFYEQIKVKHNITMVESLSHESILLLP